MNAGPQVWILLLVGLLGGPVRCDPPTDAIKRKAAGKVTFNVDERCSNVINASVRSNGIRLGARCLKNIIAIDHHGSGDPYFQPTVDLDELGVRRSNTRSSHTGPGYGRLLIDVKRWQVGIPISIGLGNYRTSYRDTTGGQIAYGMNEPVPVKVTLYTEHNLFWSSLIGLDAGHYPVRAADPLFTLTLNDWNYYTKVGLRFGEVVKLVTITD